MQNWVNVFEYEKKKIDIDTKEWLFELLEEEKIPYKEELKEEWIGIGKYAKYKQSRIVYVPKEYKEKVELYIKEYYNPNNIVYEDIEEFKNVSIQENEEFKLSRNSKNVIIGVFVGMIIAVIVGIIICQ